jgi:uncharacterized protein
MRVVLDTNVVVSGILLPSSVPARVLSLIHFSRIVPVVDSRMLAEYEEVLLRPRLKTPPAVASDFLGRLRDVSDHVIVAPEAAARVDHLSLLDADDRPFMEVAVSAAAAAIITGNTKHYPAAGLEPIRVLTPRQLVDEVGDGAK